MGNTTKEIKVDELEDILGLGEESVNNDSEDKVNDDSEDKVNDDSEDKVNDDSEDKVNDDSKDNQEKETTTTLVTREQISINKDIAKLDVKIEELEKTSFDESSFYDNLEDNLTEDEQALEFTDKSAYMKMVSAKAREAEQKSKNSDELAQLKEQKDELEKVYDRQTAIVEVSSIYPDYKHEDILNFYENDLSKSEQNIIISNSSSYKDVYINTYKKFLENNPSKIKTSSKPNIPDLNKVRRESARGEDIDDGLTSHDEQLKMALGL